MEHFEDVIIIGGGPAGAYCAFELAKKGIYATIFDPSHPREKPCGGGISPSALKKFHFLEQFRSKAGKSTTLKMISCTNNHIAEVNYSGFGLCRQFLDEQLIKMAIDNGAKLIKEKVLGIQRKKSLWQIKTEKGLINASVIVGADGINSLVRKKTAGHISSENLGLAYGYLATGVENYPLTVKFVAEIPGYIWIFPRGDHSCIGIGSESKYGDALKQILDNFILIYCPQIEVTSKFAAMLPWITDPNFFALPSGGNNWLLAGDAAGHADPITGEGILYALWSGKLAAEALAKNELCLYDTLWREQYGNYFIERCKEKSNFYNPLRVEFYVASSSLQNKVKYFA